MRVLFIAILFVTIIYSKGTISGKSISSSATISFNLNGTLVTAKSNSDSFIVDRVVDIKLNWQDSAPISVGSNEKDRVLTFNLSNWGNSKDTIKLSKILDSNQTFTPAPTNIRIFQDSNNNGVFDNKDSLVSSLTLDADSNKTLFLVADIPDGNQTINAKSYVGINAQSTSNSTSGADRANEIDTVIRSGNVGEYGIYKIRECWLEAVQSQRIISEDNQTHTGSIIEYSIKISIGGNNQGKSIKDINLTDPIPQNSLYIPNSLTLNGKKLKDSEHLKDNTIIIDNLAISNDSSLIAKFRVLIK